MQDSKKIRIRIRNYFLVFLFSSFPFTVKSQVLVSLIFGDKLNTGKVEFGLDGGYNMVRQDGLSSGKFDGTYNLGFYFDIRLKEPWFIHTGVLVKSNMGSGQITPYSTGNVYLDSAFSGGDVDRILNYFNVPFTMKYHITPRVFVEAGPMFGLRYKGRDEFYLEEDKKGLRYTSDIRDEFHPLDAGLLAGVGYRIFKGYGMNVAVRYYAGLVDVLIDDSGDAVRNQSLYFSVGIPVGVGKARARMEEKSKADEVH